MSDASATARVTIVNRSLIKLGMAASFSLDNQTDLGRTIDLVWPGIEARVVASYDFSAFRKTFKPAKIATAPENGWSFGFTLPGQRVGDPLAVLDQAGTREHLLRDFMLEAGNVYTNCDPVWVRCRVMQSPDFWDLGFAEAFAIALAGELAIPIMQDETTAADFTEKAFGKEQEMGAGGMFGKLIAFNRAAQPQGRRFMDDDPLTNARFG